jgi:hypothetical protein
VAGSRVVVPTPASVLPSGFFSVDTSAFIASKAPLKASAASAPAVTAGK